jgi:hypothetical protein
LCACCFVAYAVVEILITTHKDTHLILIYDDYFTLNGKNVFDAEYIGQRKQYGYKKYGVRDTTEKRYVFTQGDLRIEYGLLELDTDRKLMSIYRLTIDEEFFDNFSVAIENAKKHFTQHREIPTLDQEHVYYKNKRNAFVIQERDGRFLVEQYRYFIPMKLMSKKQLSLKPSWECIGNSEQNELFTDSLEEAKRYVQTRLGASIPFDGE